MSKDKLIYIVIEGGLAKAENPFKDNDCGGCSQYECQCQDFGLFERENPPLPLVSPLPVGTRITEYEIVWQFKDIEEEVWETENSNAYKNHKDFEAYVTFYDDINFETRQALKPIEAPTEDVGNSVSKNNFPTQSMQVGEAAEISAQLHFSVRKIQNEKFAIETYENGFINGANWQKEQMKTLLENRLSAIKALKYNSGNEFGRYGQEVLIEAFTDLIEELNTLT